MSGIAQTLQIATFVICNIIEHAQGSEQTTTTTQRPLNFYDFGYVGPWPAIVQGLIGCAIVGVGFMGYKTYQQIQWSHNNTKHDPNHYIEMKGYKNALTTDNNLHTTEGEVAVDLTGSVLPS